MKNDTDDIPEVPLPPHACRACRDHRLAAAAIELEPEMHLAFLDKCTCDIGSEFAPRYRNAVRAVDAAALGFDN